MQPIDENLKKYYQDNINEHGFSARGVGWKNEIAQNKRFDQLVKIITTAGFTINDLGCGSGDLFTYLQEKYPHSKFSYAGYDVLDEMCSYAKKKYESFQNANFHHIQGPDEILPADYTIASGIFNLKYSQSEKDWLLFILSTIKTMDSFSQKGFAFNMLTKYSDKEFMKDHLYYADPLYIFDFCKTNISRNVALLHDYDEYDFTILIRK